MGERLSVCVVGLSKGFHLAKALSAMPEVDLYVADFDAGKVERAEAELNVKGSFGSLEEAAGSPKVDAIVASLPHHLHIEAARLCAGNRKHLLCEKPIARTLEEADEMIRLCREAGVRLLVAENQALLPIVHEARRLVEEGAVGEPFYIRFSGMGRSEFGGWRWRKDLCGGGVLIDSGVHYIRVLRLLGGEVGRVYAQCQGRAFPEMEGEDTAVLSLAFEGGASGTLEASWGVHHSGSGYVFAVHGTRGTIVGRHDGLYLFSTVREGFGKGLTKVEGVPGYWECVQRSFEAECREFVSALLEGRESHPLSPEEARKDLEVVLAAYKSCETGLPVDLPLK